MFHKKYPKLFSKRPTEYSILFRNEFRKIYTPFTTLLALFHFPLNLRKFVFRRAYRLHPALPLEHSKGSIIVGGIFKSAFLRPFHENKGSARIH